MPDDDDEFEINQPVLNSPDEHNLIPVFLLLIIHHILNLVNMSKNNSSILRCFITMYLLLKCTNTLIDISG